MGAKDRSEPPGHEVHRTGNQAIQPAAVLSHHGAAYAEPLCNGSAHCAHPRPSAHLPTAWLFGVIDRTSGGDRARRLDAPHGVPCSPGRRCSGRDLSQGWRVGMCRAAGA